MTSSTISQRTPLAVLENCVMRIAADSTTDMVEPPAPESMQATTTTAFACPVCSEISGHAAGTPPSTWPWIYCRPES
jgi:hypothetical protein